MQTKKLALLSTMLIGLGGVAFAQQSTDEATDPLRKQGTAEQAEGTQAPEGEATQAAEGAAEEGDATQAAEGATEEGDEAQAQATEGATEEGETAESLSVEREEDLSVPAQQATGETDAGEGMVEGEAGAVAEDVVDEDLEPEGGIAGDATAEPEQDTQTAEDAPERTRSVGTSGEPYEGEVLAGMTAEELIGKDVVDANGESVGSIADLLITAEGQVDRAIIDVGGFLGFGAKPVALDLTELQHDEASGAITVDTTQEQLEAMPEWQQDDEGWFTG